MDNVQLCETLARTLLQNKLQDNNPTEDDIKEIVKSASKLVVGITEKELVEVERHLQTSYSVRMDLGEYVKNKTTYHPWLNARKSKIDTYYWNRYYNYLLVDQGWSEPVIKKLGQVSDDILDLCGNPAEEGIWKRKGLIVGDVQSGKTSNYLALCNKAADAGYKLIILLTGTVEGLRKQTQERVDAGFVGINSRNVLQKNPERKFVGVGLQDSNRCAYQFTSVLSDFNSSKLQALNFTIIGMNEPIILVLKKNKSILENLHTWLKTRNTNKDGQKIDLPLLLIDDEADNASVNTNKEETNPTAINAGIINVLKLFERSTYIAVTATPFANIFINPELDNEENEEFNLFPSDFIYTLSAPTNYIGAQKIFCDGSDNYSSLEVIDDVTIDASAGEYVFRSRAKSSHFVRSLPKSLINALDYFLLVNAVRDLDGRNTTHRSMLINVSQFVNVQDQVYEMVLSYLDDMQRKIQTYSKLPNEMALQCKEIQRLLDKWYEYNLNELTEYSWDDIKNSLYESVMPITVRLVNQKSKVKGIERLDYEPYKETGLRVIAVGGNSLSRGLTLEGLCVSYFNRNSQMYDTLMQMGRWFGYRKGYEHLFKIWMEAETIYTYRYISEATEELKDDLREMRRLGLEPRDFGLKVRQNQTSLFVTASNKRRATTTVEQLVSLSAELIETPRLIADIDKLKENIDITNNFIKDIINDKNTDRSLNIVQNRIILKNISKLKVSDYIASFIAHPKHIPFNAKEISIHIKNKLDKETWTVVIMGGRCEESLEKQYFCKELTDSNIKYSKRIIIKSGNSLLISGNRARVGVPGATKYGLEDYIVTEIENAYKKENDVETVGDKPFLKVPEREPVLLIYPIKIDKEKNEKRKANSDEEAIKLLGELPVVALGIGFPEAEPGKETSTRIKYVLNRIAEREYFGFEEEEDDIDDDY